MVNKYALLCDALRMRVWGIIVDGTKERPNPAGAPLVFCFVIYASTAFLFRRIYSVDAFMRVDQSHVLPDLHTRLASGMAFVGEFCLCFDELVSWNL